MVKIYYYVLIFQCGIQVYDYSFRMHFFKLEGCNQRAWFQGGLNCLIFALRAPKAKTKA